MRIYEFAKQHNVTNKDLIDLLKKEGFAVGNHMSVLTSEEFSFLQSYFMAHKKDATLPQNLDTQNDNSVDLQQNNERKVGLGKQESDASVEIVLEGPIVVHVLAEKIKKPTNELIFNLLKMGVMATKNQLLSLEQAVKVSAVFGVKIVKLNSSPVSAKSVERSKDVAGMDQDRLPIVVVLGHVDHGKTTLLDFIRKTRIASKEKGGITQHIGAYRATTGQGDIIFIDTPGHAAFTKIRQRGIKVADIAILVVAADDGIMPQTVEAIKQIKEMNLPVIVAVNKMDKSDPSRIDIIKRQLVQYGLLPEEWGGDVVCVPISAKNGTGIDQLLEMIILHSQMMELKTNSSVLGRGYILESKFERGRGPVVTLICQHGSVSVGDYFVCGQTMGRVTSLVDSFGVTSQKVGPSIPVQVSGFDKLADVGDFFTVVSREEYLQARSKSEGPRQSFLSTHQKMSNEGDLNLIIKTDTDSSKEALLDAIDLLSKKTDKGLHVVAASVGGVTESDLDVAINTHADIITLHVKVDALIASLAQQKHISLYKFDIIYKLLEFLQERATAEKEVVLVRKKVGEASVLRVFDIKKIGIIAGSIVKEGRFVKDGHIVVFRGGRQIGTGIIKSLQRDKKTVKEVHAGFECGFVVDGFSDWSVDDHVECYIEMSEAKK